jgi:Arc/MetJ family transcription regulator
MRTTVTLDDELLRRAEEYAGPTERSALMNLALRRYVESEAARRLARMGGSEPGLKDIPRRRWQPDGRFTNE